MADKQPLWMYWRNYYRINRRVYDLGLLAASWDAAKVTWRIRNVRSEA